MAAAVRRLRASTWRVLPLSTAASLRPRRARRPRAARRGVPRLASIRL